MRNWAASKASVLCCCQAIIIVPFPGMQLWVYRTRLTPVAFSYDRPIATCCHVWFHHSEGKLHVCPPASQARSSQQDDHQLYPVIDSTMKPSEHTHAFQINKTALTVPVINRRMMFDTLGAQLNLRATVASVLSNWHHPLLQQLVKLHQTNHSIVSVQCL